MSNRAVQHPRLGRVAVLACASAFLGLVPPASGAQAPECLIRAQAHAGHQQNDVDKVTLECMPSGMSCGASPSGAFLDRPDAP